MAELLPWSVSLPGHDRRQLPGRARRRDHLREHEGNAGRPRFRAARGQHLRAAIVPAHSRPALDPVGIRRPREDRNSLPRRAHSTGWGYGYLCDWSLSRRLRDRSTGSQVERTHRDLRQFAHRYATGSAAMTADVALTLGDPNGIGPENRNQGGFASGGDRQDISRSGGRPHVIEHYMQLLGTTFRQRSGSSSKVTRTVRGAGRTANLCSM